MWLWVKALGIPGGDTVGEPGRDDLRVDEGSEEVALPAVVELAVGDIATPLVGVADAKTAVGGDHVDVGVPVEAVAGGMEHGNDARLSWSSATRYLEGVAQGAGRHLQEEAEAMAAIGAEEAP